MYMDLLCTRNDVTIVSAWVNSKENYLNIVI